jgi:hypothetical protein
MVKHLYDKSGNDPYHKAAYDYLSSLYKGWRQPSTPPTNEETCSTQPNSQSDVLPARNQSASTNGIPPSLDQAFCDYSNVQQKSPTLESDAPPGPHAGESLSGTNNHDADSFYTVRVTFSGSLGIACDFENGSVYIQQILPNSQLMNHANVGDFVHQINQTLVKYQEDLKTDTDSNLRIITMRK